jgi:hypothetical protein
MATEGTSPLLKKECHPGCPGCAYDQIKDLQRGMPYKEFLYVWIICLTAGTEFCPISSPCWEAPVNLEDLDYQNYCFNKLELITGVVTVKERIYCLK